MATSYIIDLDHRDDVMRIVQKCNHNFKLIAGQQSKQSQIDNARIDEEVYGYVDDQIRVTKIWVDEEINDRLTPGGGGAGAVISDYIECYVSSNTAAGTTATWQFVDVPVDTVRTKYGDALSLATSGANNHGIVVSTPGYYRISGWISINQPGYAGISINGTLVTNLIINNTAGYEGCGLGYIIKYLDANDVIKLRIERSTSSDPTIAGGTLSGLTVERMKGIGSSAGGGTILGVKGEMQSGYDDAENQSGYVSISIEETGEPMSWIDVTTIYDEIFNQS